MIGCGFILHSAEVLPEKADCEDLFTIVDHSVVSRLLAMIDDAKTMGRRTWTASIVGNHHRATHKLTGRDASASLSEKVCSQRYPLKIISVNIIGGRWS